MRPWPTIPRPELRPPALMALALTALVLLTAGCRQHDEVAADEHEAAPPPSNRIEVPELVRRNLGIDFVTVQRRRIAATLRVPGHFELLPGGRHDYHAQVTGRVDVLVEALQQVEAGTPLYRIASPDWRDMQRELQELADAAVTAETRLRTLGPILAAHEAHERSLLEAAAVMTARIEELERMRSDVGGQAAELASTRVQLASTRAEVAKAGEAHAEAQALIAELETTLVSTRNRFELLLRAAATVSGLPLATLAADDEQGRPGWSTIEVLEVVASAPGRVDLLPVASGAWVRVGDLVATTTDVTRVRFRARGLQSDLPRLRDGLPARIVPPQQPGSQPAIAGTLSLGVDADPQQRTVDLFVRPEDAPGWARPGVAGFLEIETSSQPGAELAVPLAAVMQDGLERVLFRRATDDPDVVIRTPADLGADDGHWVEVLSGLADGDEVVLHGAYELVLASSGGMTAGGHFHADGSFHEDH